MARLLPFLALALVAALCFVAAAEFDSTEFDSAEFDSTSVDSDWSELSFGTIASSDAELDSFDAEESNFLQLGTEVDASEADVDAESSLESFVELGAEVEAEVEAEADVDADRKRRRSSKTTSSGVGVARFPASSHFASASSTLTYAEASSHCKSLKLALCSSAALCPSNRPLDGPTTNRSMVPVADASDAWIELSAIESCKVTKNKPWSKSPVSLPFKSRLACCTSSGVVSLASLSPWEGFLLRSSQRGAAKVEVWMVERGLRRLIGSTRSFEAYGFHYPRIVALPPSTLASLPLGPPLPPVDGDRDSAPFIHATLGINHDGGSPFELFEGYLVKKPSSAVVCMVERRAKRCVPDSESFEALGFDYGRIQVVDEVLYDLFPSTTPFDSLVGSAPGSEGYTHPLLGLDHFASSNLRATRVGARKFVLGALRRVWGREPTPTEVELHLGQLKLDRNVPRFVRNLASSNTFQSAHIYPALTRSLYLRLLERQPTKSESDELVAHMKRVKKSGDPTKNVKTLVLKFVLGKEYASRFLKDATSGVKTLYRHLLSREVDSDSTLQAAVKRVESEGNWGGVIKSIVDSSEYHSNVGLYGVPGDKTVYSQVVLAIFKALLNVPPSSLNAQLIAAECDEIAKDGYKAYVEEFLKRKEYIQENGANGFIDENDRTITLKEKAKQGSKGDSSKKQKKKKRKRGARK